MICGNKLNSFKTLMLLSTSFINLALAVSYVYLYCCLSSNPIFVYSLLQVFAQNFCVCYFGYFVAYFQYYIPYVCMSFYSIFILGRCSFRRIVLRHIWDSSLCSLSFIQKVSTIVCAWTSWHFTNDSNKYISFIILLKDLKSSELSLMMKLICAAKSIRQKEYRG